MFVGAVIKQDGDKWVLYDESETQVLGVFDTKEEAEERERQIKRFVNQND